MAAAIPLTAVLTGGWTGAPAGVKPLAVSGTQADLNAVAAIPGGGAWAVGEKCSPPAGMCTPGNDEVLKQSGSTWSQVPSPSPGGPADLVAVSADSASDAWAVGGYDGAEKSLYLHWTGGAWKQVPGPSGSDITLYGVAAISPTDALAVGAETSSTKTMTLGLHWNGKTWARVSTPSPGAGFNELYGLSAVSATDAWAVGIRVAKDRDIASTLVLHWNGSKWSQVSAPAVTTFETQLNAVSAVSDGDAWAVGQYYSPADVVQPVILHWNGSSWSRQKLPPLGNSVHVLHAVAATASDVWAAGLGPCVGPSIDCPSKTLTMHLTSSGWKVVPGVSVCDHKDQNSLFGVAIAPGSKAWAVGDYFPAAEGEPFFATLQYWNGSSWAAR